MTFQMKTSRGLLILAVSAVAVLATGFTTANAGAATPASHARVTEDSLQNRVRHELVMLPWYGVFDNLEFTVNGGEVTLEGRVIKPITKDDAEAVVKRIAGVTRVVNDIKVLPLSPFDNQTRRAVYRAIFSDGSLNRYSMGSDPSIHIIVDNGHVTLTGFVDREADRNLAFLRANSVAGIFSVTNNLRTEQNASPR